jgi:hypothetical protein
MINLLRTCISYTSLIYSTAQYERVFITGEIRTKKNGAFSSNGKKSRYQKVLTFQCDIGCKQKRLNNGRHLLINLRK